MHRSNGLKLYEFTFCSQIIEYSKTITIMFQKKNPMEDLDRAQCEMFHDIHNGEDNSASLDDAVSAITSVSRLANGQLKRCVYLLAGAWYGHGKKSLLFMKFA